MAGPTGLEPVTGVVNSLNKKVLFKQKSPQSPPNHQVAPPNHFQKITDSYLWIDNSMFV